MIYNLIRKSVGGSTVRALAIDRWAILSPSLLAGEPTLNSARPGSHPLDAPRRAFLGPLPWGLDVSRRRDSPSTCRPVGCDQWHDPRRGWDWRRTNVGRWRGSGRVVWNPPVLRSMGVATIWRRGWV